MEPALVEQVRRFNRTVTQRVGALNDAFLSRERPLSQARVLWEIGPDGCDIRTLRARLELDSGYLSRLVRSLEGDGLVVVRPSGGDGRVRTAHLTSDGLTERAELDGRADARAASILEPLSSAQRTRLVKAMAEVERLLVASSVRIAPADPGQAAARSCLRAYFSELALRFEQGYDPANGLPASDEEMTPPAGLLLVATLQGNPVGCGAVLFHSGQWAHIRRMWVAPEVRGLGLGRRLLSRLEAQAAAGGARTVRLETNRSLREAISLYQATGYREVPSFSDEPYAHYWFEKTLDSRDTSTAGQPSSPTDDD
jgi:DNA-binding MarR family transcriptional regulator/N-acetylglutamate synthase-like GNAT family acetyltransferase